MKRDCPGFTLIELLVVTGLMAILFSVFYASYTSFNRRQILEQAALDLKSNLRLAQNKALSGEKPTGTGVVCNVLDGYQVSFSSREYKIKPKCDGDVLENPSSTSTFPLPSTLMFNPVPPVILFRVLGLGVDLGDTTEITIDISGYGLLKTIKVNNVGEIK
jgi:prepilin-type N-terminal cleavage/methylation domain-containing protein